MNFRHCSVFLATLSLCSCATAPVNADGPPEDGEYEPSPTLQTTSTTPLKVSRYGNPNSYVVDGHRYHVLKTAQGYDRRGIASWYGRKFHGQLTACRETYNMFSMTAASKTLPIPVYAQVTNLENGRSVVVKVNDRGPFHADRIIDLSYAAAKKLGFAIKGTAPVEVKTLSYGMSKLANHTLQRYLQVGTFSNPKNAQALRARLSRYVSENVLIRAVTAASRTLYRVQIGPVVDERESAKLVRLLHRLGLKLGGPLTIERADNSPG